MLCTCALCQHNNTPYLHMFKEGFLQVPPVDCHDRLPLILLGIKELRQHAVIATNLHTQQQLNTERTRVQCLHVIRLGPNMHC